jgi:carbamoyltransferase
MEYGPRALGNRTIFCQPTDKIINQELNNRLGRTEFMPFAPIVMHDRFFDYFDCDENYLYPSRFMTITCKVKDICVTKAPAITHIDNTARPQVISEKQNMRVYNIIKEYNRLTGIPVLINTSFNIHEEPIVCTPDDAICSFLVDCVDILCMNDFICRKK